MNLSLPTTGLNIDTTIVNTDQTQSFEKENAENAGEDESAKIPASEPEPSDTIEASSVPA